MWEKNSFDIVFNFFLLVCEAVTRRYVSCGNWWRLIRLSVPSDYIGRPLVFIFHFSFSSINDDHVSLLLWSKKKILKHKRRPWFFSPFFSIFSVPVFEYHLFLLFLVLQSKISFQFSTPVCSRICIDLVIIINLITSLRVQVMNHDTKLHISTWNWNVTFILNWKDFRINNILKNAVLRFFIFISG